MISSTFQALIVPSGAQPSRLPTANALNDQGVQSWQVGRRSEAVAAFTAAARADANFAVPWHNRGAVFLIEGQFAAAIPDLARAAQLAPECTLPRSHLAQAYLRAGDSAAALATSDAARALDPTLPDVRGEFRVLLQARLQMARAVANRRRTYFLITLVVAILITVLTAGIGFATLVLPIYRFALFAQARSVRVAVERQLGELDAHPAPRALAAPPYAPRPVSAPPYTAAQSASIAYVTAGTLPPFSASELDGRAPTGTAYRLPGWALLIISLAALVGAAWLDMGNAPSASQLTWPPDAWAAPLLVVVAWLASGAALCVGAVAAFRRHRNGWGVSLLLVALLFSVLIVPAQLMALLYLLAMPHSPASRRMEFVPVPQVSLRKEA
ncbi:MAG: hypothetical protein PVSMB4_06920 [Ktedonobacterales bacterium]